MKAIVFAAGLGTRLGEFTKSHPKALVDVGGQTMLQRVLLKLRRAGISDVTVNVHHFADQIMDYLAANAYFGLDLHISYEQEMLLETGGGILAAESTLAGTEPVLIHNVDILTDFPLSEISIMHKDSKSDATLLVAQRKTSRYLLFDASGHMCGWTNTGTGAVRPAGLQLNEEMSMRAFGGVHIISPTLLGALRSYNDTLAADGAETDPRGICRFSIMDFYINNCSRLDIRSYEPSLSYNWCDIGKPESLERARAML